MLQYNNMQFVRCILKKHTTQIAWHKIKNYDNQTFLLDSNFFVTRVNGDSEGTHRMV